MWDMDEYFILKEDLMHVFMTYPECFSNVLMTDLIKGIDDLIEHLKKLQVKHENVD